jgi:hypothetical protein
MQWRVPVMIICAQPQVPVGQVHGKLGNLENPVIVLAQSCLCSKTFHSFAVCRVACPISFSSGLFMMTPTHYRSNNTVDVRLAIPVTARILEVLLQVMQLCLGVRRDQLVGK